MKSAAETGAMGDAYSGGYLFAGFPRPGLNANLSLAPLGEKLVRGRAKSSLEVYFQPPARNAQLPRDYRNPVPALLCPSAPVPQLQVVQRIARCFHVMEVKCAGYTGTYGPKARIFQEK